VQEEAEAQAEYDEAADEQHKSRLDQPDAEMEGQDEEEEQAETEEAEHRDDNAVLVDAWLDSNG